MRWRLAGLGLALTLAVIAGACSDDRGSVTDLVLTSPDGGVVQIDGVAQVGEVRVVVDGSANQWGGVSLDEPGPFTFSLYDVAPGARTVCANDVCRRVMVKDPAALGADEIKQRIDAAWARVGELIPITDLLPDWRVGITGPTAGLGGTTLVEDKLILVAGSERTVDDFVVTIVHELGHALDVEHLTDADRERFIELRGLQDAGPWGSRGHVGADPAAASDVWTMPAEDFAEVIVAIVLDGHVPRSTGQRAPDTATINAVREMTGLG